jgi:hypothetical protein
MHRSNCVFADRVGAHVGTLENGVNPSAQKSHLGHFRKHSLDKRRIVTGAAWLQ